MKCSLGGRLRTLGRSLRRHRAALIAVWICAWPGLTVVARQARGQETALLDVPFVPQGPNLCGGASVAMVLRYWGEDAVYAEDFQHLVDRRREGISTLDLFRSVRDRGWQAFPIRGDLESIRMHVSSGRPLIALLGSPKANFHYVVVVGWSADQIIFHDPSVGPFQVRSYEQLRPLWEVTGFWTLLALPPSRSKPTVTTAETTSPSERRSPAPDPLPRREGQSDCAELVHHALALEEDVSAAGELLAVAAQICPYQALVFRELAAVRFREKKWQEAAVLAERAVGIDPGDEHTWSLLGASRYLSGDREGALKAWNMTANPKLDLVAMNGFVRTRQDVVYRYLSLTPRTILTPELVRRTRRRVEDLPTVVRARVTFEPIGENRAQLVAAVSERELVGGVWPTLLRSSIDAVTRRETCFLVSSPTGAGEQLEAGVRWWEHRPAVWVSLSSSRMLGLPGIVTLKGFVDRQSYRLADEAEPVEEMRKGAFLTFGDWLTADSRAELGLGIDQWQGRGNWVALTAAMEHRLVGDHITVKGRAGRWFATGSVDPFHELGASVSGRCCSAADRKTFRLRFDALSVSEDAPLALWPGAGTGRARPLLLRAYPLLENGVVAGEGLGRRLLHATAEAELRAWRTPFASVGLATFFDWAMVWSPAGKRKSPQALSAVGAGLRLHALGGTVRLDAATRLAGGGITISAAWVEPW